MQPNVMQNKIGLRIKIYEFFKTKMLIKLENICFKVNMKSRFKRFFKRLLHIDYSMKLLRRFVLC